MSNHDVPEMTAFGLMDQLGSRRNAEVAAWEQAKPHEKETGAHRYWMAVVRSLIDGTELPEYDDEKGRAIRNYRQRLTATIR